MVFVYVIKSEKNGSLYKGLTKDLKIRLKEHNSGKTKSTKAYVPWILSYSEKFDNVQRQEKEKSILKPLQEED